MALNYEKESLSASEIKSINHSENIELQSLDPQSVKPFSLFEIN